jgi:uncharacterized protein with von Willebrand factor type A (vWA) domain
MLGKLKRTIKEHCPECESKTLEVRIIEEIKFVEGDKSEYKQSELLFCKQCGYEQEYKDKKKRKPVKEL